MASRIIAQLLVAGATTLLRAGSQAWAQALQNAHKTGVANEAIKGARVLEQMTVQEARMILGLQDTQAPWNEVTKRYQHLLKANEEQGSFYLQSKVFRAWERLDKEYSDSGMKPTEEEAAKQQQQGQQPQQQQQEQQGNQQQ